MQRILKFVEGEVRGLHEAAYLLGFFALLSTLLALFRDRLLATTFGAGHSLDVYYAAFRIPDVVFVSIASLVSVFILVPMLTQQQKDEDKWQLMGNILSGFSVVVLLSTAVLWAFMPQLLDMLFPTLVARGDTLLTLSRILLLQPILLGLSGILASVTQVHGRYMLYAVAPLLYNISIIMGILVLYPLFGLSGIAYGVVFGALLHLGVQVPFVMRMGYLKPKSFAIDFPQLWRVIAVSVPRTLSIASNQLALFALVAIAAVLGTGAVSVFSLAFNLQSAPLAIIGASYSVAAFPTLAKFLSEGKRQHFCDQILVATRHIIFWSLPMIVLVMVLRAHIVRVVLGSGAFDWSDTRLTAAALALFIVSLTAQALTLLFVRGYYAAGDTWKPLVVNVSTAIGIVVSAVGLLKLYEYSDMWRYFIESLLRVEGIVGTEVLMLPLAYAIFSIINVLVFIVMFERDFGDLQVRVSKTLFDSFSASVVAGFFAYQTLIIFGTVFDINTLHGVFLIGLFGGIVGIAAGIAVLYVLGSREMQEVWTTAHKKFWRYTKPIFSSGADRGTDV